MNFLIVTHVIHIKTGTDVVAYAPYVNEMNIWIKYVDKVTIIAPLKDGSLNAIHSKYEHKEINFIQVPSFSFTTPKEIFKAVFNTPLIFLKILLAMASANHIHLRCPGNMGLLGSIAQIFFPKKAKTAKYAGNWDQKSQQPTSYTMQKWILANTFLTKNIKVLVYGDWKNQTKNIKPFFTATYFEKDKISVVPRTLDNKIEFIFVGSLTDGKQPLYAIQIVEQLKKKGLEVAISLYGEGKQCQILINYIKQNNLEDFVQLKGNFDREQMKKVYQQSHFLILPSKSEGWPKVVAEAMFWGCLPIVTSISCVPNMLDFGNRGILIDNQLEEDVCAIEKVLLNQELYNQKINEAIVWSRKFTIDKFDDEIKNLIHK